MLCPICRGIHVDVDGVLVGVRPCRLCRNVQSFISKYPAMVQTVPAVADVLIIMQKFDVAQDVAVLLLGGTP